MWSYAHKGTCGLVAMTSAPHAEGRQFDPGQVYSCLCAHQQIGTHVWPHTQCNTLVVLAHTHSGSMGVATNRGMWRSAAVGITLWLLPKWAVRIHLARIELATFSVLG